MVQCPLCREFVDELFFYNEEEICMECINELDEVEEYRRHQEEEALKSLEDQYWEN